MPADALATLASAGIVLTVQARQHVWLLHSLSGLLRLNKIQDTMQNVNTSFVIFKTIEHVKG